MLVVTQSSRRLEVEKVVEIIKAQGLIPHVMPGDANGHRGHGQHWSGREGSL